MAMDKTFNAADAEPRLYAQWENAGAFKAGANASRDETFSIMIPPPNVNGNLHVGHAFNNTLQDILIRWHRMRGFDTLWQPGQDHAGIALQLAVEKELAKDGRDRKEMGREAFLKEAWAYKERTADGIIGQLKRLGASCDWSRNAFTMDDNFQRAVLKMFVQMYNKGQIYKGNRLVNWDPHFESAISDLEVENVEVDGHFWHFKYPLADGETYTYVEKDEDGNVTLTEERDYISIATTRPETMLGDGAVAVFTDDERYAPIVGKMVHLPLCDRLIPIITDEYPDPDFGSGAVKITGAHDFNDYEVAKRNNIEMIPLMDTKGAMLHTDIVPEKYRGMDRFEARKAVVADIDALGLLIRVEDKKVMQPFAERSKVVVEPMLTDQWFVDTDQIVKPAIDAVRNGDTEIMPESDRKVYFHWLENIEPWCISRQLWWGHQIPVWYDDEGNQYCAETEEEAIAQSGGKTLTRDPDVLDTWFSSGLWPLGTLGWPEKTDELDKYFPTDVLITGFDILFFWVARMMMMQYAAVDQKPFAQVFLHALVRDEHGKKMSKSVGNVIDPLDLMDEYGTDALRFTLAAMGRDLRLSEQRIAGYRNFGTKLWNATSFAQFNECKPVDGFDPAAVTLPLNKWIVGEMAKMRMSVDSALEQFRFNDASSAQYSTIWGLVCDRYLEYTKAIFFGDNADDITETRATMAWVLDQCYTILHPTMPFITEELWAIQSDSRSKMLIHADWPTYGEDLIDAEADAELTWVNSVIDGIRSVRAQMNVPAGAKIPLVQVEMDDRGVAAWARNEAIIKRLARIEDVTVGDAPKGSVTVVVEGGSFAMPLADIIDIDAEKDRLGKAIAKIEKELGGLRGRLKNPKFVDSAPEAVVAETRENLAAREEEVATLQAALDRLAELG